MKWYYPVGRYPYRDTLGLKNGMIYFYDVTAYSAWDDDVGRHFELEGRPSAVGAGRGDPRWARDGIGRATSSSCRIRTSGEGSPAGGT